MTVGYDLDGVLADFLGGIIEEARYYPHLSATLPKSPETWDIYRPVGFDSIFNRVKECPSFWLGLEPREEALTRDHLRFMREFAVVYITARPIPTSVSTEWILHSRFPLRPVVTADFKVGVLNRLAETSNSIDYFIEDSLEQFKAINKQTDTTCLLLNTPSNITLDNSYCDLRFNTLTEIINFIQEKEGVNADQF